MIGQEDTGNMLSKYVNELSDLPNTANYFFHAGETSKRGNLPFLILIHNPHFH